MIHQAQRTSGTKDMTSGSIVRQLLLFSVPLMLGNIFQMLYNTVDSIVVGNFVGTQALAAVGSTTMIVNMLVFFFNGFSVGAGVVIGQHFGARNHKTLHSAIETTMTMTFVFCVLFTLIGLAGVKPMLRFMSTPEDVFPEAVVYLRIYFLGLSGLLIYNMGSGILRAVGNTTLPLYFLILTSVLNILLDLLFVLGFHAGIAGVAWATILSQFVSAVLTLILLAKSKEIYRFVWGDMHIDGGLLRQIFAVGLPAGIQTVITSFSNIFVQSYVNFFGSSCMAGWACYNKLDQFIMLAMSSMAMAATAFVSQNIGAKKERRASQGIWTAIGLSLFITAVISVIVFLFARPAISFFTSDESVISFGILFVRTNTFFLLPNCVNHVMAGGLRGRSDSRGPMFIMLAAFVVIRQIYLFIMTRFIANTPLTVGLGYPVGWVSCCIIEVLYYYFKWVRKTGGTTVPPARDH